MDRRKLQCPSCGQDESFQYLEEVTNQRAVFGFNEDGILEIAAQDHIDINDDGERERLCCRDCLTEFPIPPDIEIDFVDQPPSHRP